MPWWNPFSTEGNDGQTTAELDARGAAQDALRARQREDQARDFEDAGLQAEADTERAASAAWQRAHKDNIATQDAALLETPGSAFAAEWYAGTERLAGAGTSAILATVKTVFKSIPWPVWIAAILYALWKLGLMDKLWKKVSQ